MRILLLGLMCGFIAGCSELSPPVSSSNTTTSAGEHPAATAEPANRTNTGVNVRDRDDSVKTPIDQNENKTDVGITADIRKRVIASKMSVNAQNVKIITQDGKVTLRGPVNSADEKQRIEEIAKAVAGADKVDSQLEVTN